ncbi:trypsin-like serine peptidase [Bacteroidota bacterium]
MICRISILLICQLFFSQLIFAQITKESSIKSEGVNTIRSFNNIPLISMPYFDIEAMIKEDERNKSNPRIRPRFAKVFDVNIDLKSKGILESVSDSGNIWRLRIKSTGAYSISLLFGIFEIPSGAELFIYNKEKNQILGAITENNNKTSKLLPIQPIAGDEIVIEYFEPNIVAYSGNLIIEKVFHDYIGIILTDGQYGQAANCNVDINCSEGDNWQNEKQSVCRILILGGYASGFLINNVDNDGTPYVMTAEHVIGSAYEASVASFVFNYESSTCNGSDGSTSQSISSSTLVASSPTPHTDFALVELSSEPSTNYNAYWSGWYKPWTTPDEPVVCIHHPRGDVKKISRDNQAPTVLNHFWRVDEWAVGTTETGSSGSPFYDANHRVVGHQSSISSQQNTCVNDTAFFGIFSSSYNFGTLSSTRLREWLDPNNNTDDLPGLRYVSDHYYNGISSIISGDIVRFNDVSIINSSDITIDYTNKIIIDGSFEIQVGSTLSTE